MDRGNYDNLVKMFLAKLADTPSFLGMVVGINSVGHFGEHPLDAAVINGDLELVQALLECGAEINALAEDGYTALHEAVEQGHIHVAEFLICSGADPYATNINGDTPLELASPEEKVRLERIIKKSN